MDKPVFNNRENECVNLVDGRTVWLSRSCAVAVTIMALYKGTWYVALAQRGPKSADFQGMWCLPCGYMDWDENGYDAARRETWEEIGFDIAGNDMKVIYHNSLAQPFYVSTEPDANRQNITLNYGIAFVSDCLPKLTTGEQEGEVSASEWKPLKWVLENQDQIAFNQSRRVRRYCIEAGIRMD